MFYLRESEATAANVLSVRKRSANVASATNVLSARKRSDSYKAPSRNGNQPHVMVMIQIVESNRLIGLLHSFPTFNAEPF
ncbi:hypothetical protein ACIQ57_04215 [Lysinibacillus xylanilyticus]|uniref:hypothetical protein n=1 Tax=Lysinibacillus xylanilyticus TaxID=582475 RepID=UPI003825E885